MNLNTKMLFLIFLIFLPKSWSFSNNSSSNQYISQQRTRHTNSKIHRSLDENFLLVDYLPDGEMERRISYNGITAIQTSVGNSR